MQKDIGDSSGAEKYFILHDISTIYFKFFSSLWKTKEFYRNHFSYNPVEFICFS